MFSRQFIYCYLMIAKKKEERKGRRRREGKKRDAKREKG
jgi:hypothetical protein